MHDSVMASRQGASAEPGRGAAVGQCGADPHAADAGPGVRSMRRSGGGLSAMLTFPLIRLHPEDNTALALRDTPGRHLQGWAAPLVGLSDSAEPVTTPGLTVMDSPGHDPAPAIGQIAGGAALVVCTTGRGSVSGLKPAPCRKLSGNSDLLARMGRHMGLDTRDVIPEGVSIAADAAKLSEVLIEGCLGARPRSEDPGSGGAGFCPWQIGAVM